MRGRVSGRSLAYTVVVVALVLLAAPGAAPVVADRAFANDSSEEVVSLRRAHSRTVRNPDGTFTTTVHASRIHYLDDSGEWRQVSSRLVPAVGDAPYAWRSEANRFRVLFKQALEGEYLRFDVNGRQFGFAMQDAPSGVGLVSGREIRYVGGASGVELRYEALPEGVKETLVLAHAAVPTHYRFVLTPPPGAKLRATQDEDGNWLISNARTDERLFVLEEPYALEEEPGRAAADRQVRLAVSEREGRFLLDLSVDPRWLRDPARTFPVRIDPTIAIQPSAEDAEFIANCASCEAIAGQFLPVGTDPDDVHRSAIRFSLNELPTGISITDAKLRLFYPVHCLWWAGNPGCTTNAHTIDVHRLTSAWSLSSTTGDLSYDSTVASSLTIPAGTDERQWLDWNVTSLVSSWYLVQQPNHGLLLKRSNETLGMSGPIFPSRRYSEPTLRPTLEVTYGVASVDLLPIDSLHSNGADLRWTRWSALSGDPFDRYEIHRSATAQFTPSATTLVATIRDEAVTDYRDTTAAPQGTFTYKLVANGNPSNERTVTLPASGQATKLLQPSPTDGKQTYLTNEIGSTNCVNHGAYDRLRIGREPDYKYRSLLGFDLRDIPASAAIANATLSLWHRQIFFPYTVNTHALTAAWEEGSGTSTCTGDGATWHETNGGASWTNAGGDFETAVAASVERPEGADDGWDELNLTSLAQRWANGELANNGILLKLADETPIQGQELLDYDSDDFVAAPTLRPKLAVTYGDGSQAIAPTVALVSPAAAGTVAGATVSLSAAAGDDRRVDKLEFYVDASKVGEDTTAPFAIVWNSTTVANGSHNLTAKATDDAGNTTTSAVVQVTVANSAPPTTSISSVSGSGYPNLVRSHSPLGYWRLGEAAGASTAVDASNNNRPGTYQGGVGLGTTGALSPDSDKAASFDGVDDRVEVADDSALRLNGNWTIEFWAKLTSFTGTNPALLRKGNASTANGYEIYYTSNGKLWFKRNNVTTGATTGALTSSYRHFAVTFDGTKIRWYIDGVLATNASRTLPTNTGTDVLQLGRGAELGQHALDEVAFYGQALSASDVLADHDAATLPFQGVLTVRASASDDLGVSKVEFYDGPTRIGEDSSPPYETDWDTLGSDPGYDGQHTLTSKAYDTSGQSTNSNPLTITIGNSSGSKYKADFSSTAIPQAMSYDPALQNQELQPVDVTVTNRSTVTWTGATTTLRYRWYSPEVPATVTDGTAVSIGADLPAGQSRTVRLQPAPPQPPLGSARAQYRLRVDLYDTAASTWAASKGNTPLETAVVVEHLGELGLGLERYYSYEGEQLGAGMQQLVNVVSGNSLLRWTPFQAPGRGLSTVVDLTYNSLEQRTDSPVGHNFSLALSGLTRFGLPLDVHPNAADTLAGRTSRWIAFADGDGTRHRFEGKTAQDGTVYWEEPAGVHLYLRQYSTTDPARKWALTRPDNVTFFYDSDGYPTSVEDRNGNRLAFTLQTVPPGEDASGLSKRITVVTDAAGLDQTPAPNRTFTISYFAASEVAKPALRGKIKRITDHTGSALDFAYYEDGNLLRITQRGGTNADGTRLPDRSFVFTYTQPTSDNPAIANAADRINPDPRTTNQSTRLFSVRDPRGQETSFGYALGAGTDNKWRLDARTNRDQATTSMSYDPQTRRTTITAPLTRVSTYDYNTSGQVTAVINPKNETTTLDWNSDRQLTKLTEPTGKFSEYSYNANGYLTSSTNQLGNRTELEYTNLAVDANDVTGKWIAGRTIPHLSRLSRRIDPKGTATVTPTDDYDWLFGYDGAGNLTSVTDPAGFATTYQLNSNGTISSRTDAEQATTTFVAYDANGLPTEILDASGHTTKLGYDDDGLLRWLQDPLHASYTGGEPRDYRTFFDHDSFHRLGRQSAPKSTLHEPGNLIWTSAAYDQNDNLVTEVAPHYARLDGGANGARTTTTYDAMDRPDLTTGPDTSADPAGERTQYQYDNAGRLIRLTTPRGMLTSDERDHAIFYSYDALDRVTKETRYEVTAGQITQTQNTHLCYDLAGDLRTITAPKANLETIDCQAALNLTIPHTSRTWYDDAHRITASEDPLEHRRELTYDANGNILTIKNANGDSTTRTYDQRNLVTKSVEPFFDEPGSPREAKGPLTTAYEYDGVGRLKRLISPHAWDVSSDKINFTEYVTSYAYDPVGHLRKLTLPTSTAYPQTHYLHRAYDANGNLTWTSLPVTTADPAAVAADQKTTVDYLDPGWIRSSKDPANPAAHFDYTAEGRQAKRIPENGNGGLDTSRTMLWAYYADGQPREVRDNNGQFTSYEYDANNNLATAAEVSGLTSSNAAPIDVQASYDAFDRLAKVRHKNQTDSNYRFTSYTYDLNSNIAERIDDGIETAAGQNVSAGRRNVFTYNNADWLDTQIDYGLDGASTDDQRITTTWSSIRLRTQQKIEDYDPATSQWVLKQRTDTTYFENGKLRQLTTKNGSGTTIENHVVDYLDGPGNYSDGNRLSDSYKIVGPDPGAPCDTDSCLKTYEYDARGRLVQEKDGHGTTIEYTLDPAGNTLAEATTVGGGGSPITRNMTYVGLQLRQKTTGTAVEKYWYDPEGNLDCVTSGATSLQADCSAPAGTVASPNLIADYAYDYRSRLVSHRTFTPNGAVDAASEYRYDPLDRPIEQTDQDGSQAPQSTLLSFVGLSHLVSREEEKDASGALLELKTYGYDPLGERLSLANTPTGQATERLTYGYDSQGSISLLMTQTGAARASYGYRAYGTADSALTQGDTNAANPLNPYRYTGKRLDARSGTLDMGARRFSPSLGRFIQPDLYAGALSNLGLSLDGPSQNRYALAGANPARFVEVDGHWVADIDEGGQEVRLPFPPPSAPPSPAPTMPPPPLFEDPSSRGGVQPAPIPWASAPPPEPPVVILDRGLGANFMQSQVQAPPDDRAHTLAQVAVYGAVELTKLAEVGPGATVYPEYPIPGASIGGHTGFADIALLDASGRPIYIWEIKRNDPAQIRLGIEALERYTRLSGAQPGYRLFAEPLVIELGRWLVRVKESGIAGLIVYDLIGPPPPRTPVRPPVIVPLPPVIPVPVPRSPGVPSPAGRG